MRTIYLPAVSRRVTLGQYVRAVRLAKQNPEAEFKHGLTTWWPVNGSDIVREFRHGLHDRINQAVCYLDRE